MHRQVKGFYDLASEYHISAATLWTQIMCAPYLYNPIAYLLRHTIELQLKGLIVYERRKECKKLALADIEIETPHNKKKIRKITSIHSLLDLWSHYTKLLSDHNVILNKADKRVIEKTIKKVDKRDFSSTRYRYPFDQNNKALDLCPVEIQFDDKAPDLELGIPSIIQCGDDIALLNKGQRLMKDTIALFDVVELLFSLMDNPPK